MTSFVEMIQLYSKVRFYTDKHCVGPCLRGFPKPEKHEPKQTQIFLFGPQHAFVFQQTGHRTHKLHGTSKQDTNAYAL